MRWRLVVAVAHTIEWRCVGPVSTAHVSVIGWFTSFSGYSAQIGGRAVKGRAASYACASLKSMGSDQ